MIVGALIGLILGLLYANWQVGVALKYIAVRRSEGLDSSTRLCVPCLYLLLVVPTSVGLIIGALVT